MDTAPAILDGAFWISSGIILFLLVLSGFFSGSETALTAASRGKLRGQADKGSKGAERALKITEDNERLIGSVLLGNNLVNILAASLATALFTRVFGESGVALATLVMTLLVLIFAEVLPKTYAITNAETAAAAVSRPIALVVLIFSPVVSAVRFLVYLTHLDYVRRWMKRTGQDIPNTQSTFENTDTDSLFGVLNIDLGGTRAFPRPGQN